MKKLIIAGVASALLATGVGFALNDNPQELGADPKTPLEATVENHEERIVDLEVKTDETQTQVNQNTADIGQLQTGTGVAPADPVAPVKTPVKQPTPQPEPEPTPEPEPEPHPWTIISVTDTPLSIGHSCNYVMYNGEDKNVKTGKTLACYEVGTLLPEWLR